MVTTTIRGHQGSFRYFQDGVQQVLDTITSVSVNQDSNFIRSYFVGAPIPEGDQSIEGWSGQIDAEVRDDSMDIFIDALITNNLNGIGVSDYTFISTEEYADGRTASYVYFDCQFKMSKNQSGLNEKMTKRLDFQASGRVRL